MDSQLRLNIKFCLFVLHLPTHFLTPYPKNCIAILWGKIFLLFDNLVGIQFLSNIFPANAPFLPILSIVGKTVAAMNAKDQVINGRLCYQKTMTWAFLSTFYLKQNII